MFSGGELHEFPRREIEDVEMRIAIRQVSLDIFFEIEAIDHQRRHRLLFLLLPFRIARIGIVRHQRNPLRIRRPRKIVHAARRFRQPLRFAAVCRHQPDLIVLLFVRARGEKREPLPVGAPARMRLLVLAESQRPIFRAIPLHQP